METPDHPDYIICYVQGLFEFRRIEEWRTLQGIDGRLRKRPIPELYPGEVLGVEPHQSTYHIIKHDD